MTDTSVMPHWPPAGSGRQSVTVEDRTLSVGDRVRLRPGRAGRAASDIFDLVLRNKIAVITALEEDFEGRIHVAVTVEEDPGRDMGQAALPAHRFYFAPDEIESLTLPQGADT